MITFLHDLRFGLRLLARNPGFTAAAALSLGLGIGINTMMFSGINSVLLKPIPVAAADRLAAIFTLDERNGGRNQLSRPNLLDYRDQNAAFDGIASYEFAAVSFSPAGREPEMGLAQLVTGNFFEVLGVRAALGRAFGPAEDRVPGQNPVAVLSDDGWRRQFAADPSIVGKTVMFNRHAFTVVGVAPRGFRGMNLFARPIAWIPSMCYREVLTGFALDNWESRRALVWSAVGRLKPGVTVAQAQANLATIAGRLERDYPTDNKGRSASVVSLAEARFPPQARRTVALASGMLMTIVGLVLLVACANVANLLLARATARRRELAMRLALGASRARIVRQLLSESVAVALLGGALAVPLAYLGQRLLLALRPPFVPDDLLDVVPDARVLAFTVVVSLISGVAFGLVPALRASKLDLVGDIKEGAADAAGGGRLFGLRNALVVVQLAVSLVALAAAGLFVRSLDATQRIDPGFDAARLGTFSVDLGSNGYEPLSQVYSPAVTLMIRAGRPPAALGTARLEVQRLDRQLPILFVTTMSEAIRQSLFLQRFGAGLLMAFGVLALALSLVGVYGVMAYTVSRRTREMGIRMALGASPAVLVRSIVVSGGRLAVVGAAVGLALALALGRVIGGLLYGVGGADPVTFVAVPAILAGGAVAASYLPARRAARIDPLSALRHE